MDCWRCALVVIILQNDFRRLCAWFDSSERMFNRKYRFEVVFRKSDLPVRLAETKVRSEAKPMPVVRSCFLIVPNLN